MNYFVKIKTKADHFKPGGVYWVNDTHINSFKNVADIYSTHLIAPYNGQKNLLVIRAGGIGDLVALSVIEGCTVVTQKKYLPVLDWWKTPPKSIQVNDPIFMVKFPQKIEEVAAQYGRMILDEIELGSKQNWYEIFYKAAGRPFGHGRPQLRDIRNKFRLSRLKTPNTLIVNRASTPNRTAPLELLKKYASGFVYHYDNENILYENDVRIGATTTNDYLIDVYDADDVITVDTSAHHFREGLGKHSLAFYGAFSAASRTKYYQHTLSIDVESDCDLKPCHFANSHPCPYLESSEPSAPCMSHI